METNLYTYTGPDRQGHVPLPKGTRVRKIGMGVGGVTAVRVVKDSGEMTGKPTFIASNHLVPEGADVIAVPASPSSQSTPTHIKSPKLDPNRVYTYTSTNRVGTHLRGKHFRILQMSEKTKLVRICQVLPTGRDGIRATVNSKLLRAVDISMPTTVPLPFPPMNANQRPRQALSPVPSPHPPALPTDPINALRDHVAGLMAEGQSTEALKRVLDTVDIEISRMNETTRLVDGIKSLINPPSMANVNWFQQNLEFLRGILPDGSPELCVVNVLLGKKSADGVLDWLRENTTIPTHIFDENS